MKLTEIKLSVPRMCSREGCDSPACVRGLCEKHYGSRIKALRRVGSTLFCAVDGWAEIQKHLPGTVLSIAKGSGLAHGTVVRIIRERHAAGETYIVRHNPPFGVGAKWERVYMAGAGIDHVVSEKRKRAHRQRVRRAAHAARRAEEKAAVAPAPLIATRWNLAFFNPAQVRA